MGEPLEVGKRPRGGPCDVCGEGTAKYCCPACVKRTCSLPCVQAHKKADQCSGKRSRTAFVPIGEFGVRELVSDMQLLDETDRCAGRAARIAQQMALGNPQNKPAGGRPGGGGRGRGRGRGGGRGRGRGGANAPRPPPHAPAPAPAQAQAQAPAQPVQQIKQAVGLSRGMEQLVASAAARGTHVRVMPRAMSMHRENRSAVRNNVITWSVACVFVEDDSTRIPAPPCRVAEDTTMAEFLASLLDARDDDESTATDQGSTDNKKQQQQPPKHDSEAARLLRVHQLPRLLATPREQWGLYIQAGYSRDASPVYYRAALADTWRTALQGAVLVEFPHLYVTRGTSGGESDPLFPLARDDDAGRLACLGDAAAEQKPKIEVIKGEDTDGDATEDQETVTQTAEPTAASGQEAEAKSDDKDHKANGTPGDAAEDASNASIVRAVQGAAAVEGVAVEHVLAALQADLGGELAAGPTDTK